MASEQAASAYVVRGRVQGVGFRFFVVQAADELSLAGYVKNRADGTVEVYAVGAPQQLAALRQRLWEGPRWALVEKVEEREAEIEALANFQVRY